MVGHEEGSTSELQVGIASLPFKVSRGRSGARFTSGEETKALSLLLTLLHSYLGLKAKSE